jgi:hypothetical protein
LIGTGFRLFEETNDLFFRESALLHVRHSPWFDGLLTLDWYGWRGAGQLGRRLLRITPRSGAKTKKRPGRRFFAEYLAVVRHLRPNRRHSACFWLK